MNNRNNNFSLYFNALNIFWYSISAIFLIISNLFTQKNFEKLSKQKSFFLYSLQLATIYKIKTLNNVFLFHFLITPSINKKSSLWSILFETNLLVIFYIKFNFKLLYLMTLKLNDKNEYEYIILSLFSTGIIIMENFMEVSFWILKS